MSLARNWQGMMNIELIQYITIIAPSAIACNHMQIFLILLLASFRMTSMGAHDEKVSRIPCCPGGIRISPLPEGGKRYTAWGEGGRRGAATAAPIPLPPRHEQMPPLHIKDGKPPMGLPPFSRGHQMENGGNGGRRGDGQEKGKRKLNLYRMQLLPVSERTPSNNKREQQPRRF